MLRITVTAGPLVLRLLDDDSVGIVDADEHAARREEPAVLARLAAGGWSHGKTCGVVVQAVPRLPDAAFTDRHSAAVARHDAVDTDRAGSSTAVEAGRAFDAEVAFTVDHARVEEVPADAADPPGVRLPGSESAIETPLLAALDRQSLLDASTNLQIGAWRQPSCSMFQR